MISHDEEHWKEWQTRHRSKKPWDLIPEIAPIEVETREDESVSTFLERKKPIEVIKKKKHDY
jgi:hypothetical protein